MTKSTSGSFEPLKVKIAPNKNHADKRVGFIGKQLCFFEKDVDTSVFEVDSEVEVMITRALYGVHPEGHAYAGKPNFHFLRALMIRPVDKEKFVLFSTRGFTKNLDTNTVLATGVQKGRRTEQTLSPGRTGVTLVDINETRPLVYVWVDKTDLTTDGSPIKISGLTKMSDGRYGGIVKKQK